MHSSNACQLESIFPKISKRYFVFPISYRSRIPRNSYFLRRVIKKLIKYTRLLMHSSKLVREDSQLIQRTYPTGLITRNGIHERALICQIKPDAALGICRWMDERRIHPAWMHAPAIIQNEIPPRCGAWWYTRESEKKSADTRRRGEARRGEIHPRESFFPFCRVSKNAEREVKSWGRPMERKRGGRKGSGIPPPPHRLNHSTLLISIAFSCFSFE